MSQKHDELCLQGMDDLQMEPEAFGALLYMAAVRKSPWDSEPIKEETRAARRKILSLPYGHKLLDLERKILGIP